MRAIKHDVPEVIVTPVTGRPLATLAAVAADIGQTMMRLTGVQSAIRRLADSRVETN